MTDHTDQDELVRAEFEATTNETQHSISKAKIKESKLDYQKVSSLLAYDANTGNLYWKQDYGNRKSGTLAGSKEKNGYLVVTLHGKKFKCHRVVWLLCKGAWPSQQIDHINCIRDDNRISNLRDVSQFKNQQNQKSKSHKLIGASFHKSTNKWMASIRHENKNIYLGIFPTEREAHDAYMQKRTMLQKM